MTNNCAPKTNIGTYKSLKTYLMIMAVVLVTTHSKIETTCNNKSWTFLAATACTSNAIIYITWNFYRIAIASLRDLVMSFVRRCTLLFFFRREKHVFRIRTTCPKSMLCDKGLREWKFEYVFFFYVTLLLRVFACIFYSVTKLCYYIRQDYKWQ